MKTAYFGWEADQIHGTSVAVSYPIGVGITILGYQFDLGMMAWKRAIPFTDQWFEVLFSTGFTPQINHDFGAPIFTDHSGTAQNLHGGAMYDGNFCAAILKGFCGSQDTVNKSLVVTNLNLVVPANTTLYFNADHAGYGPVDFEAQGCIFYE
jgi:hypothetical protein